jgi:beta-lactam-binding protein with PASTA domain
VRLSVSIVPNSAAAATVPKVVGQDQAAAATALRDAGFKPLVLFRKTTDPSKDGLVLEQQPPANTSIPRGSYLAIFVGRTG